MTAKYRRAWCWTMIVLLLRVVMLLLLLLLPDLSCCTPTPGPGHLFADSSVRYTLPFVTLPAFFLLYRFYLFLLLYTFCIRYSSIFSDSFITFCLLLDLPPDTFFSRSFRVGPVLLQFFTRTLHLQYIVLLHSRASRSVVGDVR